jgi:hypothetical protein
MHPYDYNFFKKSTQMIVNLSRIKWCYKIILSSNYGINAHILFCFFFMYNWYFIYSGDIKSKERQKWKNIRSWWKKSTCSKK